MWHLENKRALVTGAASGIGRALALELARHGTHLVLADRNQVGLARTATEVAASGVECVTYHYDAEIPAQVTALAQFAQQQGSGIDILVNNAGITYHGATDRMKMEHWDQLVQINVMAPVRLTQELLPLFIRRPEVHILNVCSVLGLVGLPKVCAYNTSKFALVGFSESLRSEYGKQGIGVTALCPGLVKTNLFASSLNAGGTKKSPPEWLCSSPDHVARLAVRAIRRNRRQVVISPLARLLSTFKRLAPGLLDWSLHLNKKSHTERRLAYAQRLAARQAQQRDKQEDRAVA